MVRVSPSTFSAASGELSALMHGRRDFARFANGARACRGFITLPEGPVTRMPGTRFMGFTASNNPGRLMAFIFRDEDAVLLEWTASLLRFWRNGALVLSGASPYSIATPYPADRLAKLQSLQSSDRIYLTDGSIAPQTLSRFALDDWTIAATEFTGGPFADRNLDEDSEVTVSAITGAITMTASADIWTAAHVGTLFQLFEVDTSDTPYWSADVDAFLGDQTYYDNNCYEIVAFDDQQGRTGAAPPSFNSDTFVIGADNQVIWDYVGPGNPGTEPAWAPNIEVALAERRYFAADDYTAEVASFSFSTTQKTTGVNPPTHLEGTWLSEKGGVVWQYLHSGSGIVRITAVTDPQTATAEVQGRLPDGLATTPTYRWAEQAWSTSRGWPRAIGGFEQRHIYGGTPTELRTLWFGVIGGTTDMSTGANDDDGFSYILASKAKKSGEIRWIVDASDALFIGTSADVAIGRATDADRAFARETAKFTADIATGCADTDPVLQDTPVFLDKTSRRIMATGIDGNSGRFTAENLTQISRHILGPGATKVVRQESPIDIDWFLLTNGELAGMTYDPQGQVIGFHRHNLAGGHLVDMEVLPTNDGLSQQLWLMVRRVIGGVTRHCIERLEDPFVELDGSDADLDAAWFQFCALRWTGTATTTIPGFAHLAGETVTAWTDLGAYTDLLVAGDGTIILPDAVTSAIIGLDATDSQRFDTLDVVTGQPDGGDDGRLRTHRVTGLRVHRSAGGTYQVIGVTDAREYTFSPAEPIFRPRLFEPPALHEGVVELGGHKGWNHQMYLRIKPQPGAPLTIVSRTPTLMITDD